MFKDAMLWRFLGIASSTVGLVCYALSSSFRHLYGKWSILTITLYVVVSSIISFITLFAENLKGWRYFGLKAHVVFLVLMATSLYSVFYDKTVDGKPDTLSVISNGAFSLMSLSLSRQTNVGFESGISNFFLGCLTVQLMKINWMLTSAAALFCYLVIVVRSHLDSQAQLEVGPVNANDSVLIQLSQGNSVQPIGNIAERFHALCLKDSGVLYEDPYVKIGVKAEWRAHQGHLVLFLRNKSTSPLVSVEATIMPRSHLRMELSSVPETIPPRARVECPLEVINLRPSRDVADLDFSYKIGNDVVNVKLRLPAVLNKFLHPISVSAEEFFPQWRSLSGPPLKLQEVVRGVRPLPLNEMANLFSTYQLAVCPGLDPNPNNLVASTTFYSENTRAMLCLIRIETEPADRTQLRMTVASGDPELTFELKEFIKEMLVSIPMGARVPA